MCELPAISRAPPVRFRSNAQASRLGAPLTGAVMAVIGGHSLIVSVLLWMNGQRPTG